MRGAAPSVVCPRCGNESPPSGAGRFMTCAKCGMSIDASAVERQHAVRGRVKERPEVEIDPALPPKPSKFPLGPAIALAVLVIGGATTAAYILVLQPGGASDAQRENLRVVKVKQEAFATLWDSFPDAHQWTACKHLKEVVDRPCKSTVDASRLAFEDAAVALAGPSRQSCADAVTVFLQSRTDAKCD